MSNFRRGNAAPQQTTPAPVRKPSGRPNTYGSRCTECGGWVEAEAGLLTKTDDGKWGAKHIECPREKAPAAGVHPLDAEFTPNYVDGQMLFDGVYTIQTAQGHRTFRLKTQKMDEEFMPGAQIVQFLSGPDNTYDYTSFGHIKNSRLSIWKRHQDNEGLKADIQAFLANPEQAEKALNCYRCGHLLTTPESIATGMGPECSRKGM